MRNRMLVWSLALALLLALAIPVALLALEAQAADIPWEVIGSGGAPSAGPGVSLNGTLGQPIIALSSGMGLDLEAGYWYGQVQAAEEADLAIDKQALAASVTAGQELAYTITITNLGPGAATDVVVLDLVPPGTHVVSMTADNPYSASGFCSLNGTCHLGLLPAGTSITSPGNSTPGQADGSTIDRTVTIGPGDLLAGSTIADVDIAIEFEKLDHENCANPYTGGSPYNPEIVFYLTSPGGTRVVLVDNGNNWGGSGLGATYTSNGAYGGHVLVTFDDAAAMPVGGPMPVSGTFRPVQPLAALIGEDPFGTWTLTAGDSASGDALCLAGFDLAVTAVRDIEATVSLVLGVDPDYAGDTLANQAQVSAHGIDPDETNNIATATTTVHAQADQAIDKFDLDDPVEPKQDFFYQLVVSNRGPSAAREVVVTDTLGPDLTFVTASPGCSGGAGSSTVVCTVASLPAGESTSFLLAVAAGDVPAGTVLTNQAVVASATPDDDAGNNADVEQTTVVEDLGPSADLSLDKQATPGVVEAGGLVTYTLIVRNAGPTTATDVEVREVLPAGTHLVSISADNPDFDNEFCASDATCYLGTVYHTTVARVTVVVEVDVNLQAASLTNLAYVSGDQVDSVAANNLDTATVEVTAAPRADLAVDKMATPTAEVGGTISYTIQVYNDGPMAAANVVVTDTLPPQVTFASAGAGCNLVGSSTVVCHEPLLDVDQAVTFHVVVTVNGDVPVGSSVENVAVAGSDAPDPDLADNLDTADCSIIDRQPRNRIYLPLISRNPAPGGLPDLVGSFHLVPDKLSFTAAEAVEIEACVTNQGTAPAGPFWVDLYINPDPVPDRTNLPWNETCSLTPCYGLAWQVPAGLAVGQTVCLRSTPDSYAAGQTFWPGSFAPGTTDLYLYVDSWNPGDISNTLGACQESDERNNQFALHGLSVTGSLGAGQLEPPAIPPRPGAE